MKSNGCKYHSKQGMCAIVVGYGRIGSKARCLYTNPKQDKPWCHTDYEPEFPCDHDWVSADNNSVSGALFCNKCFLVKSANG